jgi:hypothetical protein
LLNGVPALQSQTSLNNYYSGGAGNLTGTGSYNSAQGYKALFYNTTGSYNSANGYAALYSNTTGSSNTANGFEALFSNTTGSSNTANGFEALYSNTTGSSNTAQGYKALYSNTTGSSNTANGYQAGQYIADGATVNQTSSNSVYEGFQAYPLASGDTNENVIGNTAIGHGSNTTTLGNSSITDTYLAGIVHGTSFTGTAANITATTNSTLTTLSALSLPYSQLTGVPTLGTWAALNYPTWTTGSPFVKMTAAGTFALDTNSYATTSQLPSTLSAVAHKWLNSYTSGTGLFTQTQPACGDLSDAGTGCSSAAYSLPGTVVQTNQANAYGAYLQDFSSATQVKHPVAAGYVALANGEMGYDSTNLNWHAWDNGADWLVGMMPKTGLTNNHCAEFSLSGNTWTLADAGGTCTTGGSMVWPTTAGIVYWTSGTTWGGAYNSSTPIPANYLPAALSSSTSINSTTIPASSTLATISGSPVSPNVACFSASTAIGPCTSANIQTAIGASVYDAYGAAAARQANLSLLAGTYVNGDMCTYTASGTLLNCNTTAPTSFPGFGTTSGTAAQGGVIAAGGPTGSTSVVPVITYNAAGQLTAVTTATITPAAIGAAATNASTTGNAATATYATTAGGAPPTGSASGDLSSSYPGPSVVKVNGAAVPTSKTIVGTNSSGQIVDASSVTLANNTTGTATNLAAAAALPSGTTIIGTTSNAAVLSFGYAGTPPVSQYLGSMLPTTLTYSVASGCAGSHAYGSIASSTTDVFQINKCTAGETSCSSVGTVTFTSSATGVVSCSSAFTVAPGQSLNVTAPSSAATIVNPTFGIHSTHN